MKLIEDEKCPRCGATFSCSKSGKCWCFEIDVPPSIIDKIDKKYSSCLCPHCLKQIAQDRSL